MRASRKLNSASLLMVSLLAGCSFWHKNSGTPDNEPTLKSLAGRIVVVNKDQGVDTSEAQAITAYRRFLEVAPNAPQRAQAMRRIGDLEMERADVVSANSSNASDPDFSAAIASYQEFLSNYPNDSGNDKVLYQLARAQEQGGDLVAALTTLNRLVSSYPESTYSDEAQFRRGELLFAASDYTKAELAYNIVLQAGTSGRYYDRALYMRGWSQFKLGQLDEALKSFFGVLDVKIADSAENSNAGSIENIAGLSRADRELVEDTFRVMSLSLANLDGADSIAHYINSPQRLSYEFRIYEQLGQLYLKQERVKDAADAFGLFARLKPLNPQAPLLQERVIEIYEGYGFAGLALDAKKEYVARYGSNSEFRRANPAGWEQAQALVKIHVAELARHYHASAQLSKNTADYQEAIHWYREYLDAFPTDPQAAENNFLLAELLFEDQRYAEAGIEYEKTAYDYPPHNSSADAGYGALLSYAKQLEQAAPADVARLQTASVTSALHFANSFSGDPRAAPVLANAAEKLYQLKQPEQAAIVAKQLLALQPEAAAEQRRIAWTVLAYTSFEQAAYADAELAFAQVLTLTAANAANRNALVEQQAAAIYKQGELARSSEQLGDAVKHFERIATVAPDSPIRATAQYDAAAAQIGLKNWDAAAALLEDFRVRYPKHPLQPEVNNKLAVVYLEQGQWARAAVELDHLASASSDVDASSAMLWQAAELYEKAGSLNAASKSLERYQAQNKALLPSIEARWRLADIAKKTANPERELVLMQEIFQLDQNGGAARTDRSRYLGAKAALALAEPIALAFRKIALVEPLKKQLKLKKAKMELALTAYTLAGNAGVVDVSTEATYQIASIYRDFGKALLDSERPGGKFNKLSKIELEQYNVLLEEQAFPFEEKAIDVYQVDTQYAAKGIYDKWVQLSFDALRELQPVRFGKTERSSPDALPDSPNQLGIALRKQGKFEQAAAAYQQAITLNPNDSDALLNLGILNDLYLGDAPRAFDLYSRYLALKPEGDTTVSKWLTEVKNRLPKPLATKEPS